MDSFPFRSKREGHLPPKNLVGEDAVGAVITGDQLYSPAEELHHDHFPRNHSSTVVTDGKHTLGLD